MGNTCAPVGSALPPRRDQLITAADTAPVPSFSGYGDSIIVPQAKDRMRELIEREQLPTEMKATLAGSLTGDMQRQQLLFQAMIDTWPHLSKALREVKLAVRNAPWQVNAWAPRGKKPTAASEKLARFVEDSIWGMKPDMIKGLKGFEGTLEEITLGYFMGHYVGEIHWQKESIWMKAGGETEVEGHRWLPQCSKTLPPRFYGYPYWDQDEDRLMLDRTGGEGMHEAFEDFPEHRFLVGVNGAHSGHPTIAAPLRALTGYWMAAVYGLKWLMQYAQLFGVPFRWAEYEAGDPTAKAEIMAMMRRIGTEGWAAFPKGTKMEFLNEAGGGSSLVQRELLKLADEQCDIFILGQTLTSSQGDKGSQALGTVHMQVRQEILKGVCDFAGEVLTHQFAPSIVALNYGDRRKDIPGIWAKFEAPIDEQKLAERDNALGILSGKVPVAKAWFYERHKLPMPAEGEELLVPEPQPVPEPPKLGPDGQPVQPDEDEDDEVAEKDPEKVAASEASHLPAELKALLKRMEKAAAKGGIIDADAIADLMGAAWINSAKKDVD
ncbi:DUF935 domain-containing protein [Luteolibacter sp. GHJ8]|uniref:DUF935 domain-containing protein n=1 Tax=Luteolibacter rhizosphaerae TaxID=2989719 RepID=A0ABT3G2I1_9BACT|nr:DUF935 domain-containing protein [Luteolibacter rhizosphaerae]MCW1913726.1 DUF935 domain-containing protein [Luteolibacter rhizosphaerae]